MMSVPYVPIEQVAKHFTVSLSTIRAWVRQGKIPSNTYIKVGNTYRFRVADVENALVGSPNEASSFDEELGEFEQLELDLDNDE
jgi:excisionase family DNA binding protein